MSLLVSAQLLLLSVFALTCYGQTPENAVQPDRLVQQAVDGTVRATLDATKPKIKFPARPGSIASMPPSPACAVPLLEMTVPKGVRFTLRKAPPIESPDHMPAAHTLPACPDGR
jgi:hypothetical protein